MYSVEEIAGIVQGLLLRSDGAVPRRIVHDSRSVLEGDLFVALHGHHVDGHVFLSDAFARGACSAMVSDPSAAPVDACNLLVVSDPLGALQRLAATWRTTLDAPIVGITGSNGKTTTRALLAYLLRASGGADAVFNAPKNYNTEIGLPLALLSMSKAASIGLFELGAEQPGDIKLLTDILAPAIGLITSVGPSHLDGFGSVEAVAKEKWALVDGLSAGGYAVANADSPYLCRLAEETSSRCLTVGLEHGKIRGRIERVVPQLALRVDDPPMQLECPLLGAHNAVNLLLAAVTADQLGVPPDVIEERAKTFPPVPHRLQPISTPFGTILDDTYNANPNSVVGALHVLAQFGGDRTRRVFVFGEMLNLGPDSDRYHREALDLALRLGIDVVLPVGDRAVRACEDGSTAAVTVVDREKLARTVRTLCSSSDDALVLIKGSNALQLERLVAELVDAAG